MSELFKRDSIPEIVLGLGSHFVCCYESTGGEWGSWSYGSDGGGGGGGGGDSYGGVVGGGDAWWGGVDYSSSPGGGGGSGGYTVGGGDAWWEGVDYSQPNAGLTVGGGDAWYQGIDYSQKGAPGMPGDVGIANPPKTSISPIEASKFSQLKSWDRLQEDTKESVMNIASGKATSVDWANLATDRAFSNPHTGALQGAGAEVMSALTGESYHTGSAFMSGAPDMSMESPGRESMFVQQGFTMAPSLNTLVDRSYGITASKGTPQYNEQVRAIYGKDPSGRQYTPLDAVAMTRQFAGITPRNIQIASRYSFGLENIAPYYAAMGGRTGDFKPLQDALKNFQTFTAARDYWSKGIPLTNPDIVAASWYRGQMRPQNLVSTNVLFRDLAAGRVVAGATAPQTKVGPIVSSYLKGLSDAQLKSLTPAKIQDIELRALDDKDFEGAAAARAELAYLTQSYTLERDSRGKIVAVPKPGGIVVGRPDVVVEAVTPKATAPAPIKSAVTPPASPTPAPSTAPPSLQDWAKAASSLLGPMWSSSKGGPQKASNLPAPVPPSVSDWTRGGYLDFPRPEGVASWSLATGLVSSPGVTPAASQTTVKAGILGGYKETTPVVLETSVIVREGDKYSRKTVEATKTVETFKHKGDTGVSLTIPRIGSKDQVVNDVIEIKYSPEDNAYLYRVGQLDSKGRTTYASKDFLPENACAAPG